METSTTWQVLRLRGQDSPRLLVRHSTSANGYQIDLTDLSRVWGETLTRAEIEKRATSSGSSIDPSQDKEQYNIFLDTIRAALDQHDSTTLEINTDNSDDNELFLNILATLPRPLLPFRWKLHLRRQDTSHIASNLVSPLLHETRHLQKQVEQLVHELREKDRVISKICDRLETSGNDLTTVFPGVSHIKTSRKHGQREQLAKHIKGLGDFDEDAWRATSDVNIETGVTGEELNAILRSLPDSTSKHDRLGLGEWWKDLPSPSNVTKESAKGKAHGDSVANEEEAISQDAQFQRQATPPNYRQKSSPPKDSQDARVSNNQELNTMDIDKEVNSTLVDSSTEDEDDLDAPPESRNKDSSERSVSTPPSRERVHGESADVPGATGKKENEQQREGATSADKPSRKLGAIGGRSSQPPSSSPTDAQSIDAPPPATSRPKLGAIGGKPKASTSENRPVEGQEAHPPHSSKLGAIGGKRTRATDNEGNVEEKTRSKTQAEETVPERSRPLSRQSSPAARETSQERADKKRDALKKELEAKAKAPTKKKRRF